MPRRRATSWWNSRVGRKVSNAVFRIGVGVWATAIVVMLAFVMLLAVFLLVTIIQAALHEGTKKPDRPADGVGALAVITQATP